MSNPAVIVEQLLQATYAVGPGRPRTVSFMFGDIGDRLRFPQAGTELHIDHNLLTLAALTLRQNGPSYLRKLPMSDIHSMLISFLTDHYAHLAPESFFPRIEGSYAQDISAVTKAKLADALQKSLIWQPRPFVTIYPLIPVRVDQSFESGAFFFQSPQELTHAHLGVGSSDFPMAGSQFPPVGNWRHRTYPITSWLGIRAPARQAADRQRASILGAFALALPDIRRYTCSGRDMYGGWCTFDDNGVSVSVSEPVTPALADDWTITRAEHSWLSVLVTKLEEPDPQTVRQMRALEYFYRAWFMGPADRFPALYMALESIFGDANHATQAVIDGVRGLLGEQVEEDRLRLLSYMRAAVLHGGAPEVYDSSKYAKYVRRYHDDPVRDLDIIVAECLRKRIFQGALAPMLDPHAEVIARAVREGRMSALQRSTILGS